MIELIWRFPEIYPDKNCYIKIEVTSWENLGKIERNENYLYVLPSMLDRMSARNCKQRAGEIISSVHHRFP
jgi:hypothetical protein